MHVQFEFTKEDLVDAHERFLRRGKAAELVKWKTSDTLWLIVGLLVFLVLRKTSTLIWVSALIFVAIIGFVYPRWLHYRLRKKLRSIVDEVMTAPGPYICEVEPRSEGLWVRQMGEQAIYEWKDLETLEEAADSVDIFSRDVGGVIVRNRAFVSERDRVKFVEIVRAKLAESRG